MCDRDQPRFLTLHHVGDGTPIDLWMNENLPHDYRLIGVTRDKIITDDVVVVHEFFMERCDG